MMQSRQKRRFPYPSITFCRNNWFCPMYYFIVDVIVVIGLHISNVPVRWLVLLGDRVTGNSLLLVFETNQH